MFIQICPFVYVFKWFTCIYPHILHVVCTNPYLFYLYKNTGSGHSDASRSFINKLGLSPGWCVLMSEDGTYISSFFILSCVNTLFCFFFKDYVVFSYKICNDVWGKFQVSYSDTYTVMWDNYRFYFCICAVKLNFKRKFLTFPLLFNLWCDDVC